MDRTKRIRMDKKKTRTISIRCTPEMERRIREKADDLDESVSEFIMDEIEAGLKRKTKRDKRNAKALVEIQEEMNMLIAGLDQGQDVIRQQLIDFSGRMVRLWQY